MDHYKYLGVLKPDSDNLAITDARNDNPIIIEVSKTKWRIIAALNKDHSKAMIYMHNNKFSLEDKITKIENKYFRCEAVVCSIQSSLDDAANNYFKDTGTFSCEKGCELHNSKKFAYIYAPGGWCNGGIYLYRNKDTKEITAVEIRFCSD
jgi:hypothetical protein